MTKLSRLSNDAERLQLALFAMHAARAASTQQFGAVQQADPLLQGSTFASSSCFATTVAQPVVAACDKAVASVAVMSYVHDSRCAPAL